MSETAQAKLQKPSSFDKFRGLDTLQSSKQKKTIYRQNRIQRENTMDELDQIECPICGHSLTIGVDTSDGIHFTIYCEECNWHDEENWLSADEFGEVLNEIFSHPSDNAALN